MFQKTSKMPNIVPTFKPESTNPFSDIYDDVPKPPKNTNPDFNLKKIADIFNSFATRKTITTGFFNLALVITNFQQMKFLITRNIWVSLNIVVMSFIGMSLLCQFVVAVALVFMAKESEFIDETKRNALIRRNNFLTLLVLFITILNIFINVFLAI